MKGVHYSRLAPLLPALLALAYSGVLWGQPMTDTLSSYADSWASSTGVIGYGSTTGALTNIHRYAVSVTLTSPRGRRVSVSGAFQPSTTVTNQVLLSWDSTDLGQYTTQTTHQAWCGIIRAVFWTVFNSIYGTVGTAQTYYKDPVKNTEFPGSCWYRNTACSSGTPKCTGGWGPAFQGAGGGSTSRTTASR